MDAPTSRGYQAKLPKAEKDRLKRKFAKPFPAEDLDDHDLFGSWRHICDERSPTGKRVLYRYNDGAMMWVDVDPEGLAVSHQILEDEAAGEAHVRYTLRFPAELRRRIEETLTPGRDADEALKELFGPRLIELRRLPDSPAPDAGTVRRYRHIYAGVISLHIGADNHIRACRLLEQEDAAALLMLR